MMTICRNGAGAAFAGMTVLAGMALACGGGGSGDGSYPNTVTGEQPEAFSLRQGSHQFAFRDARGNSDRPITVRYHMPAGYTSNTPVVFVMHGNSRTGQSYFDVWEEHAIDHGFLLVVPEFDDAGYPGSRWYNLGNIFPGEEPTTRNPASTWTYTAIEHLFDVVRAAAGSTRTAFRIYGHSAGSQFVHRFLMTRPDAPVERAVAANAGWYTLPSDTARWPYGLGHSGFGVSELAARFQLPVTILLGDADTVTTAGNLRRAPEALSQGPHRFARGHTFYGAARSAAQSLGVPFAWTLDTVPGAGHSNRMMAPRAAEILTEPDGR